MGLNFIRAKAEQFLQKTDAACEAELSTPDLLTRVKGDCVTHYFNCQLTENDADLRKGVPLVARAFSDSDVRLMQRGKFIAHVLPEDAELLTTLMRKNHHHGVISVVIESEASFDGVFRVKSKRPFKNH